MTLLTKFENPGKIVAIFLGKAKELPTEIQIKKSSLHFRVRTPMDIWVIKETCIDMDYLPDSMKVDSGWNIVDIGAGLGDFTVLTAKNSPNGTVHAYEPLPESSQLLHHNLALNSIQNAICFAEAVAAKSGTLTIASGNVEAVSTQFVHTSKSNEQTVTAVSLQTVLNRLPNQHCDWMKIDCEGGEFDIILNSPPELLSRIDRLSMEYHDSLTARNHLDLVKHLKSNGFQVDFRENPVHADLGFIFAKQTSI